MRRDTQYKVMLLCSYLLCINLRQSRFRLTNASHRPPCTDAREFGDGDSTCQMKVYRSIQNARGNIPCEAKPY